MESSIYEETIENFSKLTYRQRFAITEYGYLLSPDDAEVVGKMLGNFQEKDVLPFCQANGKKVIKSQKISPSEIVDSDMTQISIAKKILALENQVKVGINWFFWIAGLSLLNSIIFFAGGSITFVVGLGATQIIDVFSSALAREINSGAGTLIRVVGFILDFLFAGIFALCGILGRKRFRWAIIIGMVLYALDGLISLAFRDWLGAFFHAFALTGLWRGLKAINDLALLEKSQTSGDMASLQNLISSQQPADLPPVQHKISSYGSRLLIMLGIVILGFITFVSAFSLIGVVISSITVGTRLTGNFWSDIFPFILSFAITAAGSFGVFRLVKVLRE